jgi:fatty acid desaturase
VTSDADVARVPSMAGAIGRRENDRSAADSLEKPNIAEDYRALNRRIRREGLYATNHLWYVGKYAMLVAFLASSWVLAPEEPMIAGLLLGLFCQQAAFIGHDLGHGSVMTKESGWLFRRKYKNWGAWVIGNVCFGVDGLHWSEKHSAHHLVNLRYGEDPQNGHLPWILYEAGEIPYYEASHGPLSRFQRKWLRYQHLLMIPLMLVYGKLNILKSQKRLVKRGQYFRLFGIGLHLSIWAALLMRASNPVLFLVVALAMCGIIHIQILLSHAYMPRFTEEEQRRIGWIRYQVVGTQNVDTTWYDGWFHGGLQYQIEHHLFAAVPRHNLPKIQPWVMDFCARHGLPYNSDLFRVCIADMLKSFYQETRGIR